MYLKTCTRCKEEKPAGDFYTARTNKDGLQRRCKPCQKAANLESKQKRTPAELAARMQRWREKNPEKHKENYTELRARNVEKYRERTRKWQAENPEAARTASLRWKAENPEKVKAQSVSWREKNPDHARALWAENRIRRRYATKAATPGWANRSAIAAIYKQARALTQSTGREHHVDHIVPLSSPLVCGLHCEQNLQVLEGLDNSSKGNRHWPDMP